MPLDFAPRPQSAPANAASSRRDTAFAKLRTETLLRKLEPRIMFDAAALATAVDALHHDAADSHSHTGDVSHSSLAAADIAGLAAGSHGPIVVQSVANFKQVVFIDAGVQDPAAIEQAAGPNDEIVLLDPHEDGLTQIAQFLAGHEGLDAIHIVSHGAAGELILGSSTYNSSTIKGFDAELAAIGASLQPGGDILLYGCDVAQGAVGDAFVHKIADLTHANVSASTDLTGNAAQGGNWVLEDHVGAVHTAAIQAQAWQGELGSLVTVSSNNTAVSNTFQNNLIGPGITATNETQIGVASQFGTFDLTGKATKLPLSQGIVMVTGNAGTALTTSGNTAADFSSNTNGATSTSGNFTYNSSTPVTEVNLNGVAGGAGIWNPAGYIFDFTAATNRIGFVFSFASEEYQNYVGSIFNDAFGFFIKGGTQYAATTNLALVPGTSEGISINTINSGVAGSAAPGAPAASWDASNSKLYIDNSFGSAGADPYVQYNGLTKLLTVTAPVTAGTSYHMEISIGDAGDNALDSAVFFHNQGFLALTSASNNAYATAENATVSGNVISDNTGNGADLSAVGGMSVTAINGAAFGVSPVTLASGAQVTMHSDGTFIYDPTHSTAAQALLIGQSLNDTFTYTNTDSSGVTDTATVTIKVTNTDHAPVASNDAFGTSAGVAVKIPVLANDTDVDAGDVLTVSQVAGHAITAGGAAVAVTGGSVTLDSSGNLTFSPTAGYTGAASFTYTIDDGHHGTSTATVSGHVYAAPVAVADSFTTAHDTTATINVLGNDTDANGFSLAVTAVNGTAVTTTTAPIAVTGGTVILDAAGQLEFSANAGFTGPASFAYTVDDGHGGKAIGTVSGSVTDAAPIVDLNGAAAGASYVTTFTEGSAAVAIAAPTSTVVDADNTTMQSAKIVLTNAQASDVLALGLLPTGIAGAVDTSVAGKVTVTLTGTATSADYAAAIQAIAFSNASQNPNTTARTIDVTVNDGMLSSAIVVSTVQVVAVDNPPVETVPAPVATNANAPVTITGLSVSDVDANGGIETVTLSAAHGTITLGSTAGLTFTTGAGAAVPAMTFKGTLAQIDAAIASLTYAPGANYAGADTLTFTTNDNGNTGSGGPLAATQTLALNVMDVPPTAHDDSSPPLQARP